MATSVPFFEHTSWTVPVFLVTTQFRHNCEHPQFPLAVAYYYDLQIPEHDGIKYRGEGC